VRPVGSQAQKARSHERVQNSFAHHRLDAAQTLYLLDRQFHARHLQILGAETVENLLIDDVFTLLLDA
jgi:hypothetical protein